MRMTKGYSDILQKLPEDKRIIGEKLVKELLFMETTLERLKRQINEAGEIERFQQGKQDFLRESPALKSYTSLVQRYSVMHRQLTDLIDKSPDTRENNAVFDFLQNSGS